jgi:hypothetical protein
VLANGGPLDIPECVEERSIEMAVQEFNHLVVGVTTSELLVRGLGDRKSCGRVL